MVIVSRHGAQLAFVGIFCGFARARLERNQDLRNQQVAIRDTKWWIIGAMRQRVVASRYPRLRCGALDRRRLLVGDVCESIFDRDH